MTEIIDFEAKRAERQKDIPVARILVQLYPDGSFSCRSDASDLEVCEILLEVCKAIRLGSD